MEQETIELISGGIEPGEKPEEAAIRELLEETGYSGDKITRLSSIQPYTTVISGTSHLVFIENVAKVQEPDQEDILTSELVPFEKVLLMVEDGTITHGPSCLAILQVANILRKRLHESKT